MVLADKLLENLVVFSFLLFLICCDCERVVDDVLFYVVARLL